MNLSVHSNITALNAERMLGLNNNVKVKSTERLSSGYKINRAADDAAGLAISEKTRRLIRGLSQGTKNAQDGISWVQIGDGALDESQAMLQRMNELSIKSLNGTNSESDRKAMDAEFQQLKTELDRVGLTTKFNDISIFSKHKEKWYQTMGNKKWKPYEKHRIEDGENDLTFLYRTGNTEPPPGAYYHRAPRRVYDAGAS